MSIQIKSLYCGEYFIVTSTILESAIMYQSLDLCVYERIALDLAKAGF